MQFYAMFNDGSNLHLDFSEFAVTYFGLGIPRRRTKYTVPPRALAAGASGRFYRRSARSYVSERNGYGHLVCVRSRYF